MTLPMKPYGHVVLPATKSDSYRSLRHRTVARAERFKLGRSLRQKLPRAALGSWKASPNRPDPVAMIARVWHASS